MEKLFYSGTGEMSLTDGSMIHDSHIWFVRIFKSSRRWLRVAGYRIDSNVKAPPTRLGLKTEAVLYFFFFDRFRLHGVYFYKRTTGAIVGNRQYPTNGRLERKLVVVDAGSGRAHGVVRRHAYPPSTAPGERWGARAHCRRHRHRRCRRTATLGEPSARVSVYTVRRPDDVSVCRCPRASVRLTDGPLSGWRRFGRYHRSSRIGGVTTRVLRRRLFRHISSLYRARPSGAQ